ncbi:MAG: hypothetical protein RMH97_06890 [Verrucomicrobiales bacterium]|nr:hypothetical protein [Verrucomicrobiales bacterium]
MTYRYERFRAVAAGIIETAGSTFLVLGAVRWLGAGPIAKALVAAGTSAGLLISPLLVAWVAHTGIKTGVAAAQMAILGAAGFFIAASGASIFTFVLGSVVGMACASAVVPILTQIYQDNYPEHERGFLFSRTMAIRIATAALFAHLAGHALTKRTELFPALLVVFGCAHLGSAWCLHKLPSRNLLPAGDAQLFSGLRFVKQDALFRRTLAAWMLMGFGNLMMAPLRVEFLSNPKYGVAIGGKPLTASAIALLTGVLPNLARLAMNPFWGWIFDRVNFFVLRIVLNLSFLIGIFAFFSSASLAGLIIGAVAYGIAIAGGDVAWSLWVTKIAPPERVADYMGVHTFLTGLRGVVAPIVGFQLAATLPISTAVWISAGLIAAACAMLIPEVRYGARARAGRVLVEEVSE